MLFLFDTSVLCYPLACYPYWKTWPFSYRWFLKHTYIVSLNLIKLRNVRLLVLLDIRMFDVEEKLRWSFLLFKVLVLFKWLIESARIVENRSIFAALINNFYIFNGILFSDPLALNCFRNMLWNNAASIIRVINSICAKYSIESLHENLCLLNKAQYFRYSQKFKDK